MFAWGKKKADAGGEAPKFESATLPNAGQNPMNSLNQVAGTTGGYNNPAGGYAAPPAGNYPQTPYGPVNLASATAPTGSANTNPSQPAAGGYGNPAVASTNAGAPATAATQPQNGPYNPNYNAVASTNPAPAPNYGAPSGYGSSPPPYIGDATAPTDVKMGSNPSAPVGGPDYRMADSRNTMPGTAPAFGGAPSMPSNSPAATAPTNYTPTASTPPASPNRSLLGDRYANVSLGPSEPSAAGGQPNSPSSDYRGGNTGYQGGATGYQPAANANPVGATGYQPPSTNTYGDSGANPSPLRTDPGYSPGGTGRYTPQNTLRPSTGSAPSESTDRYPSGNVVPAHFETTDAAASNPVKPASAELSAPETKPTDDRQPAMEQYGPYQGASTAPPPELFPNHAF